MHNALIGHVGPVLIVGTSAGCGCHRGRMHDVSFVVSIRGRVGSRVGGRLKQHWHPIPHSTLGSHPTRSLLHLTPRASVPHASTALSRSANPSCSAQGAKAHRCASASFSQRSDLLRSNIASLFCPLESLWTTPHPHTSLHTAFHTYLQSLRGRSQDARGDLGTSFPRGSIDC